MKMDDSEYTNAQQAETLREQATDFATAAVQWGKVDRDWVNGHLIRMGAQPVTVAAQYKINIPITGLLGLTVEAKSRAEALARFNDNLLKTVADGRVNGFFSVFDPQVHGELTFHSGPEDPQQPDENAPTLDAQGVRDAIRAMLKEGVSSQGWGHSYAQTALDDMGIEQLPALTTKTVQVPVSGTASVLVRVFEGDDDETVQKVTHDTIARSRRVVVDKPDEVGPVIGDRSALTGAMGLTLVDDEDDGESF